MRGKKVGIELTYRSIINGMQLDVLSDVKNFPFDKQQMDIKIEFSSKNIQSMKNYIADIGDINITPII